MGISDKAKLGLYNSGSFILKYSLDTITVF